MKKLLLIDGNSVLFRAYYATLYGRGMSTSSGVPTNAVFGFITMFNKAMETVKPDCVLVAWDAGKPTFRHKEFEAYKGTRKPLDEDLIVQMPIVREFLDEAHVARYEEEGYEADDIIGSMAKSAPDMETTILTSDKDLLQLVDSSTKVLLMKKGLSEMETMDEQAIWDKYELKPEQIIDLKGLMGDPSDNIPGVKGVGEKTALKYLHSYGSVEGVYDHIDDIRGKAKEKLEAGREDAKLSKELATIYTDMHLPFSMEDLVWNHPDLGINAFYQKYEMRSLMKNASVEEEKAPLDIRKVDALPALEGKSPVLVAAASLGPFLEQQLYGFAVADGKQVCYIEAEAAKQDPGFAALLQRTDLSVWDAKDTLHLLDRNGFALPEFAQDLHLAAFLLYSQATSDGALIDALELPVPFPYKDLSLKTRGGDKPEKMVPFMEALAGALKEKQDWILEQVRREEMEDLYRNVEMPLVKILYEMEKEGIRVDEKKLAHLGEEFSEKLEALRQEIYSYASGPFNIDSPKQLATLLFDELKLPSGKKRSTAVDVLEKLQGQHPVIDAILEYRKFSKLMVTYVDGLKKHIVDGRIHTTFNQTMTQTGRLSSSDPNLQNISVKTEDGRKIREVFVPDPGHVLISADYSQIELRVLAHMADEQIMIETFEEGVDIHTKTASQIFQVPPADVTDSQRRVAKTVNFGIIYGQTDFGLAQELKISRHEAKEFMQTYFATYPNIHRYMNSAIDFCKEHGYAKTMLNRRRPIPEINDKNFMTREFGKRAAMNAPIQGTAADLIKVAMIKVDRVLKEKNLKSRMLLQIHDELIFDVPEEEKDLMMDLVQETMDHAMKLHVPLQASVHAGNNWAEAK